MNQPGSQKSGAQFGNGGNQPHEITVNIAVILEQSTINLQIQIDPEIPFNAFVHGIKEQIFAQRMQSQYDETIDYQLVNSGALITQNETRTLTNLGFKTNCQLQVRLKLKGG